MNVHDLIILSFVSFHDKFQVNPNLLVKSLIHPVNPDDYMLGAIVMVTE